MIMPMYVTQPTRHGGDRLHMSPPPCQPPLPQGLSLRNYHIRNGWCQEIAQATRVERIGRFDIMFLIDTKITYQAYCHNIMR